MGTSAQSGPRLDRHGILSARDARQELIGGAPVWIFSLTSQAGAMPRLDFDRRIGWTFATIQLVCERASTLIMSSKKCDQLALARIAIYSLSKEPAERVAQLATVASNTTDQVQLVALKRRIPGRGLVLENPFTYPSADVEWRPVWGH